MLIKTAKREWLDIYGNDRKLRGRIPRDVVEAMGIDCTVVDDDNCLWFSWLQTQEIKAHPEWVPAQ